MPFVFQVGAGASQDRLEKLIALRLQPGVDKEEIDGRIWDLFGETWAIMFTDLSGFSRRSAKFGIIHFLQTIYESQHLLVPVIDSYDGILLKMDGDSMMVLFRSPAKAVECAVSMQHTLRNHNTAKSDDEKILLCVGIGYGTMLRIGDADVFGPQVNASAKLGEDTARAYEILVTDAVRDAIGDQAGFAYDHIDIVPPGANSAYRLRYR
jgi:class 3 adenylate cyclase